MKRVRRIIALLLVAATACGTDSLRLLGGGGSSSSTQRGRDRGTDTLIVGRGADALGLDPARFTDNESIEVCEQIYEHLVRFKPGSTEIEPQLATGWEVSEDGKVWTFRLRAGVFFHDGSPFDADAVKFSFERQLQEHHRFHLPDFLYWKTTFANWVRSVEVVDPMTVRIYIYKPYAPFLASLAMFPVSIISPTAVERQGADFARHPVGTGPFRFVSWAPGDRIIIERNEGYWGVKPRLKRVVFKLIPDARQRLVALEGGAIDVAYNIQTEELQFVQLHPDLTLHKTPGQNVAYLAMNTMKGPFADVRVRHALNHAINKVPIVKLVYQGLAVPATGALPPTMWSYNADVVDYPYDPDRARALLAEAAAAGTFDPSATYKLYAPSSPRPYLPDPERVARALQRNLEEVGVHTELVLQDLGAHLASVERGDHDLCVLGWAADLPDPDNFMYLLLSRDNAIPGIARNVAFYRDAEVAGLLQYAQETNDRGERETYYRQAQERIARDAPWVPLAHSQVAVSSRKDVEGLVISSSGFIYYDSVWLGP
jgi:peptide/nickel transport system substrate-binding protein